MSTDNLNLRDQQLVKNKAEKIISLNQNISIRALVDRLKKNNIPQNIIDELVIFDDEKQIENALHLIKAKYKLIKGKTPFEREQKLLKYLTGKGYCYEIAGMAMEKYLKDK